MVFQFSGELRGCQLTLSTNKGKEKETEFLTRGGKKGGKKIHPHPSINDREVLILMLSRKGKKPRSLAVGEGGGEVKIQDGEEPATIIRLNVNRSCLAKGKKGGEVCFWYQHWTFPRRVRILEYRPPRRKEKELMARGGKAQLA